MGFCSFSSVEYFHGTSPSIAILTHFSPDCFHLSLLVEQPSAIRAGESLLIFNNLLKTHLFWEHLLSWHPNRPNSDLQLLSSPNLLVFFHTLFWKWNITQSTGFGSKWKHLSFLLQLPSTTSFLQRNWAFVLWSEARIQTNSLLYKCSIWYQLQTY